MAYISVHRGVCFHALKAALWYAVKIAELRKFSILLYNVVNEKTMRIRKMAELEKYEYSQFIHLFSENEDVPLPF